MGQKGVTINGGKIKRLRQKEGKTQKELIKGTQLTLRTYQRAEEGKPVSASVGRDIAGIFKTPLAEIVSATTKSETTSNSLRFQPCNGKGGMKIMQELRHGIYSLDFEFEIDPNAEVSKLVGEVVRICQKVGSGEEIFKNDTLIEAVGELNEKLTTLQERGIHVHFAKEYYWRVDKKDVPYSEPDISVAVPRIEAQFNMVFSEESGVISRALNNFFTKVQAFNRCHRFNYKAGISADLVREIDRISFFSDEYADGYEEYLKTATPESVAKEEEEEDIPF